MIYNLTDEHRARIENLCLALESGEFKQVDGALRKPLEGDEFGYCCLGVACELYRREIGGEWDERSFNAQPAEYDDDGDRINKRDYSDDDLPVTVQQWYGLPDTNPELNEPDNTSRSNTAITNNDELKRSFPEIAARFRTTYLS